MWFLVVQSRESLLGQRDGGHDRMSSGGGEEDSETKKESVRVTSLSAIRSYVNSLYTPTPNQKQ